MTNFILVLALAIIVEALIEYAKTIYKAFEDKDYKTAITQVFAIGLAILLCFAAGADIFAFLGITFAYWWVGIVLTGIFASRGSNYVSDLVSKLQNITKK